VGGVGVPHAVGETPEAIAVHAGRALPSQAFAVAVCERCGDLHRQPAHAEEQQPRTPLRELAVEGEPQPETVPVERLRGLGVGRAHHGVVEREDHRLGRRLVLDREEQHTARLVEGKRHAPPRPHGARLHVAPDTPLHGLRREPPCHEPGVTGVRVVGAERQPDRPLAAAREVRLEGRPHRTLTGRREQLEVGVLETEQHVRRADAGVLAPPRRTPPQQPRVAAGRDVEIGNGEDDVVECVQHGGRMTARTGHATSSRMSDRASPARRCRC
jgi:hypothetical protein